MGVKNSGSYAKYVESCRHVCPIAMSQRTLCGWGGGAALLCIFLLALTLAYI